MKTIAFHTLGCKVNQFDTQAMLESFERAGWTTVDFSDEADAYLINTCTVTGTGDQKSKKIIRRVAREHPEGRIIVAGCLAQRDADAILAMDNVSLVVGAQRRGEVVSLFSEAVAAGTKISAVAPLKGASFEPLLVARHEGKTRATLKIQEGCDRFCSYCIIPSVRGPVRSMPLKDVRAEAVRLAQSGYRELVVTGIHLASYGRGEGLTLLDALKSIHEVPGVERIRLGSLEPGIITPDFVNSLLSMEKIMPQFHLSMQSGSSGVLLRMRRRYTPEEYFRAVELLKKSISGCAITTDVLTGFPGETAQEAAETLAFVEKCGFARIHVFPYSRRKGTAADAMPMQLPEAVKRARAAELIVLGNRLEEKFVLSLKGTVQKVLFETQVAKNACEGYTGQYVRVRAPGSPGQISDVEIISTESTLAYGKIIGE